MPREVLPGRGEEVERANYQRQRWRMHGQTIRSEMNGKCLTVLDGRGTALTPVVLWPCSGRANQRWHW